MDQYPNTPSVMRGYAGLVKDIYRDDELANNLIKMAEIVEGVIRNLE
jgi:hypothetical protein